MSILKMAMEPESETTEDKSEAEKFNLSKFNITDMIDAMKKQMKDDVFVMDGIALQGQATALYAKPNTGKTLLTIRLLIDSVKAGRIDGRNIHYINADDTFNGMILKGEIFAKHGISMLVPGFNGFDPKDFTRHVDKMVKDGTASGAIVVLDTLKKFTNLMDKNGCSGFMAVARRFVTGGGTLIMLAHTNKRRDHDNKLIAGGTSDVIDDADCAYLIDEQPTRDKDTKTVMLENVKSRGNIEREICFSYSTRPGQSYKHLLESVVRLSHEDMSSAKETAEKARQLENDTEAIDTIKEILTGGSKTKTELIKTAIDSSGISRRKIKQVIDRYTANTKKEGGLWCLIRCEGNTKEISLIREATTAEQYLNAKEGM